MEDNEEIQNKLQELEKVLEELNSDITYMEEWSKNFNP